MLMSVITDHHLKVKMIRSVSGMETTHSVVDVGLADFMVFLLLNCSHIVNI